VNDAILIAAALDKHLSAPTEVIVYGAAALLLDAQFAQRLTGRRTNDIDIIIPASRELQIDADRQFWASIDVTNRELAPRGLFISHLFPESEVVLSPDWHQHLCVMDGPWKKLRVLRPRILDLILSKMRRGDAADLADVRAMLALARTVQGGAITPEELTAAANRARVPDSYREIFPHARDRILQIAREASGSG